MAIIERGEGNARRRERLAQIKKGPGTFVFLGGHDTEYTPTPMRTGKNVPVLDANGMPIVDGSGRQVFQPPNTIDHDEHGQPRLGGPPKVTRHKMDKFELRGVTFEKDKPTQVNDHALALKLRCMQSFKEVDGLSKLSKLG